MAISEDAKIVSEWFVRPEHEVEAAKQPRYLGPLDLCFLYATPIQKGLLFPFQSDPTRPEVSSLLERLKRSLSIALVHFYPLAGLLECVKYEDEQKCLIYLDCSKGPGARLIHAAVDLSVSDILSSTDVHPAVLSFFDLGERMINHDGRSRPLLSTQVTELRDGVFIGFTMNHSVVDGTSFIHFVNSLSEIFRSEERGEDPIRISHEPRYKMYLPDGLDPVIKLPCLEPGQFIRPFVKDEELRERIFHIAPESMASLKAKANEECGIHAISSFMALSSLLWRSITRARNLAAHEDTSCNIIMNARSRLDPPLSDDYFGNFLVPVIPVCKVDELLGQSLGSAASFLSLEVKKNSTPEAISRAMKMLLGYIQVGLGVDRSEIFRSANSVVLAGSARFNMYGPEFGLGRAIAVRMGFPAKENGKVTTNPGREGRGSVDLEISLSPHVMSALELDDEFMTFATVA